MTKTQQIFNIRETAEELVPDRLGRTSYLVALLVMLLMLGLITVLLGSLPPVVPFFFTLPWGEARLSPRLYLYILPAIILLLTIFNLGLGKIAAKLSPLLPRVLAVTTAVTATMLLVALLGIVQSLLL